MKEKDLKRGKRHIFFMFLLVLCLVMLCGCKKKEEKKTGGKETELLLSFDSYREITKTGIQFGNQFGKTEINQNKNYIKEGEGSWQINPQGDYGKEDKYPYFRMQTLKDDYADGFATSNFDTYDKVLLDIYNDSDEEIQIKWSFTVWNARKNYVDTEDTVCTLKPNAWTTCEFDLSGEDYSRRYRLESVKYMEITFLTRKDSKDDTVPRLYLDNLRGHISNEKREFEEFEYDMREGLTFENVMEQYAVSGEYLSDVKRISFAEAGIEPLDDSMGEYVMVGDATDSVWPRFVVDYGQTYEAGSVLNFMIYVEADERAVENRLLRLNSVRNQGEYDLIYQSSYQYNQWIKATVILSTDAEQSNFFVDFDNNASGISIWDAGEKIKIYMDNVRISDLEEEAIVNPDGSVTMQNPYYKKALVYAYDIPVKAGQYVKFDIDVDPAQHIAVWVMGDGFDEQTSWKDEYYAQEFFKWNGKQTIRVKFPEDNSRFTVRVQFCDDSLDLSQNKVTLSNVEILDLNYDMRKGLTFENTTDQYAVSGSYLSDVRRISYAEAGIKPLDGSMGRYALVGNGIGTWPGFIIDYDKTYKAGMVVSFMMYVQVDEKAVSGREARIEGTKNNGLWNEMIQSSDKFNQWIEVKVILAADTDWSHFYVNLEKDLNGNSFLNDGELIKVYIDNIRISEKEPEAVENADGSVTLSNPYGKAALVYTYNKPVKAGEYVSFDIDVDPAQHIEVWVMGDGFDEATSWTDEYFAQEFKTWSGKQTIRVKFPENSSKYTVRVQFCDKSVNWKNSKVTISNMDVFDLSYDMRYGLTFEKKSDQYAVNGSYLSDVRRISYAEAGIKPLDGSMGSYALVGNGIGTWPGFIIDYDKTYKAGMVVSFMMYVQVDEKAVEGRTARIEGTKNNGLWNEMIQSSDKFNQWIEVKVILAADTNRSQFYVNLEKDLDGNSFLNDREPIKVYIDNIRISEKEPEAVENADGSVTLNNPYGKAALVYTYNKSVKAGEYVSFDIDVDPAQHIAVWVMGDGFDEATSWTDEYFAQEFKTWSGKQTIRVKFPEDNSKYTVRVQFYDKSVNWKNNKVTLSDMDIFEFKYDMQEGLTFEKKSDQLAVSGSWEIARVDRVSYLEEGIVPKNAAMGDYAMVIDGTGKTWPGFAVDYDKTYQKGQMLSFMLYVQVDPDAVTGRTVNIEGKSGGAWDWVRQSSYEFNQWIEVKTILCADADKSDFYVNFSENEETYLGNTPVKIYLDNVRVTEPDKEVVENEDGSVTLLNPYWESADRTYNIGKGADAGSIISFDIEFSGNSKGAVWILGDGSWDKEYFAKYPVSGKTQITTTIGADVDDIQIYIGAYTPATDGTEYAITISNLEIFKPDVSKGLTFEKTEDLALITSSWEKPEIKRVSYAEAGIQPLENKSMGDYALLLDGTGKIWPGIFVNYGKTYQKDMMLSFMLYIQVDPAAATDKWVRIEEKSGSKWDWVRQNSWDFNQWIEVKVILCADTDIGQLYLNFADSTEENTWFGDTPVKIYLDNIRIGEQDKEVMENEDGSVTLFNPFWEGDRTYNIGKGAVAGSTVSFDIEFAGDSKGAVWILGDGSWEKEYYAKYPVSGKTQITTTIGADVDDIQIYVGSFTPATDGTEYAVTISNIKVTEPSRMANLVTRAGDTLAAGTLSIARTLRLPYGFSRLIADVRNYM